MSCICEEGGNEKKRKSQSERDVEGEELGIRRRIKIEKLSLPSRAAWRRDEEERGCEDEGRKLDAKVPKTHLRKHRSSTPTLPLNSLYSTPDSVEVPLKL